MPFPGNYVDRLRVVDKALELVDRKVRYSWLDIVAIGLSKLRLPMGWAFKRLNRGDRLICSQLVAVCWEAGGVKPWPVPAAVTPGDILVYADGL